MSQVGNDNQLAMLKQSMFIEDGGTGQVTQVGDCMSRRGYKTCCASHKFITWLHVSAFMWLALRCLLGSPHTVVQSTA